MKEKRAMKRAATKPTARASRRLVSAPSLPLKDLLRRSISWAPTGDLVFPWKAELAASGKPLPRASKLKIRLNDFPDEQMYTLLAGRQEIGSFDDWPVHWKRGGDVLPGAGSTPSKAPELLKRLDASI
jgi:hypothetical protein